VQHRSVLEAKDFVEWANENVVLVVGHDGATGGKEKHKPLEVKEKEGTKEACPRYPGLTCAEHEAMRADVAKGVDGFGGKIEVPSGFPNSWMVGPDGTVEAMDKSKSVVAKGCQECLVEFQKKFEGKPLTAKKHGDYRKHLADGDKAADEGKWKAALASYAKVDADAKKLPKALLEKVASRAEALNGKVADAFAKVKEGDGDAAAKLKAVRALRSEVGAKLSTGPLACAADLDAWIKEAAAAAVKK
jgi:hypothetical protein